MPKLQALRSVLALCTSMGISACGSQARDETDLRSQFTDAKVAVGIGPATYLAQHPQAIVIVASPDICFACQGALLRLLQERGSARGEVALFLTRSPDQKTAKLMLQYRLRPDGVLLGLSHISLAILEYRAGHLSQLWIDPSQSVIDDLVR